MNDLLNALTNARPDESDLDRVWGQQDRAATLQRAQRRASTQGRRRRIVRTTAAATVTALVGVPALGAWQQAAAAGDLRDLSRAAAQDTAPVLGEGDFLHVVSRSSQDNSSLFGDGRTWVDHRECWVRWDGQEWCVETREGKNYRDLMRFHPEGQAPRSTTRLRSSSRPGRRMRPNSAPSSTSASVAPTPTRRRSMSRSPTPRVRAISHRRCWRPGSRCSPRDAACTPRT